MLILQGLKRYFTLSGFTRRAHGFYPVIEEIVEGFLDKWRLTDLQIKNCQPFTDSYIQPKCSDVKQFSLKLKAGEELQLEVTAK